MDQMKEEEYSWNFVPMERDVHANVHGDGPFPCPSQSGDQGLVALTHLPSGDD